MKSNGGSVGNVASATKKGGDFVSIVTSSVHELLKCPLCIKSMYPPIHQCPNGHTICSACKLRVHNQCPTCGQELGDIQCLALEKMAEVLKVPCEYFSLGCREMTPYYCKPDHEKQCNFRPYNCPDVGSKCSVVGNIPSLVAHLRDDHKVHMDTSCTFNYQYVESSLGKVESGIWMPTVVNYLGQYFCLHVETFQREIIPFPVYMAFLIFMGNENEAKNYRCSLEVGGYGRKKKWEGSPRSIRDSHCKARDSSNGLIIDRDMALFFSGGLMKELNLTVTGRIWKDEQNSDCVAFQTSLASLKFF